MFAWYRNWRRRRLLARAELEGPGWRRAEAALPLLAPLSDDERRRLRALATLFLAEKQLTGAGGFVIDRHAALMIALQAALPILELGLDWYRGWVEVIVYPESFVTRHEFVDEAGVVHEHERPLQGESWLRGPVILSWPEVAEGGALDGGNLVIHEFAHKLDMLNGVANGFPPLHPGMDPRAWTGALTTAFEDFRGRLDSGRPLPFDGYAAEDPAEFFAVVSEVFFEWPARIWDPYPDVYEQLRAFYRQDPVARFHAWRAGSR